MEKTTENGKKRGSKGAAGTLRVQAIYMGKTYSDAVYHSKTSTLELGQHEKKVQPAVLLGNAKQSAPAQASTAHGPKLVLQDVVDHTPGTKRGIISQVRSGVTGEILHEATTVNQPIDFQLQTNQKN